MALECTLAALGKVDQTDPAAVQALLQQCVSTLLDPTLWEWALLLTVLCAAVGAMIGWAKGRYGPTQRPPVGEVVHLDRYGQQPFRSP